MEEGLKNFNLVLEKIEKRGFLTSEDEKELENIFGKRAERALTLVFLRRVKKYVFQPSGRIIWIVVGRSREYIVIPESEFCMCDNYLFSFLRGERSLCIHLIAQKVADALKEYEEIKETDEYYFTLLDEFIKA